MSCKISLSDIDKISADFDNLIQQERETDSIATASLREYAKLKLDESYKQEKSKIYRPINVSNNLGFISRLDTIQKQYMASESKLESLLEESKIRIYKISVEYIFESLRINRTSGFIAACQYLLDQPIITTPKPYRLKRSKII